MVAITYVRCGGKTSYRYDKNGQMIEEKTGDSYHITYSYDKAVIERLLQTVVDR